MRITFPNFNGIRPVIAPHLLPAGYAQTAENCKLYNGRLQPWNNEQIANTGDPLVNRTSVLTIHKILDTVPSAHWLEFTADVNIVGGPVSGDTTGRIYYTGDGIPKKTNTTEAVTGSGAKPINFWPIAIPHPTEAPAAVLTVAGGTGSERSVAYVWTLVTTWGEESKPSLPSDVITANEGDTIEVSGMSFDWSAGVTYAVNDWVIPTTPNGYMYKCVQAGTANSVEPTWGTDIDEDTEDNSVLWRCYEYAMSEKRIYRTNSGTTTASWQYVDGIDDLVTSYDDSKYDVDLGEILATEGWDPPPDGLTGLVSLSGGMLAGFFGKDIYISEPYYPHAWPSAYSFPLPVNIVGLGAIGNSLIAVTTEHPYVITGTTPEAMSPIKMPESHPCVSKRSIAESPAGIIYATPSGLYRVTETEGEFLTLEHFGRDEWQALHPETANAAVYNGRYFMFYDDGAGDEGGIIFNLNSGMLTTIDFYAPALYVDRETDELYFVRSEIEVLLLEDGTPYPDRANVILLENESDYLLTE